MKTRKYRRYSWYRINVADDTVTGGAYSRPSQPSTRHPRPARVGTASLPSIHSATRRMGAVMAASTPTESGLRPPCGAVGSRASGASRRRCRKRHAPGREPPRPGRHAPSSLSTPCKRGRSPVPRTSAIAWSKHEASMHGPRAAVPGERSRVRSPFSGAP